MTEPGTRERTANIGVVGLAVMGANLARNLASREGNTVAVLNRSRGRTEALVAEHPEAGFVPAYSYEEFAASLSRPRTAIIMVQAGAATDATIEELVRVFEPGDIIVDGGNAYFPDTIRRERAVRETGINFVGAGISGGEEGALNGPSIMPGGSDEAWETLGPILRSIAAVAEGEPRGELRPDRRARRRPGDRLAHPEHTGEPRGERGHALARRGERGRRGRDDGNRDL
jgi:6-phosphogluconate dehydrogenase